MLINILGDRESSRSWMDKGAELPILHPYLPEIPSNHRGWEGIVPGDTEFHAWREDKDVDCSSRQECQGQRWVMGMVSSRSLEHLSATYNRL